MRQKALGTKGSDFDADAVPSPDRPADPMLKATLEECLSKVRNADLIVQTTDFGRTVREIAEEEGESEDAVESRLRRAKRDLRSCLERRGIHSAALGS